MNKKRSNKIVAELVARRRKILFLSFLVAALVALSVGCIILAIDANKNYYIHYDEKSNLDYKVYLKESDYFGEYLEKDQQYIASLIDHVEVLFDYSLVLDDTIDFSYYYYIEAITEVLDANGKTLYQKVDDVVAKKYFDNKDGSNSFALSEKALLDYNYYNNLVQTFLEKYKLNYTTSSITLQMYVGIEGECEGFESKLDDNAVISLSIPLTTQTVDVSMSYSLSNSDDKLLECRNVSIVNKVVFVAGCMVFIVSLIFLTYLVIYCIRTRSAETIYMNILKKIFKDYGRYISKIKSVISYKGFQVVQVEEFEDLFEVRNSSQAPILFIESERKMKSAFIVPTNSKLVYVYYLVVEDIKNEKEI